MKLRTDVLYSLIAFESILVAVAAFLWFPTWVLAIAIATFVFSTIHMVIDIVRMRNNSYDETKGKKTYRFPIERFIYYAMILIALTATVILCIKMLFGYMLVALTVFLICLLIFAIMAKMKVLTALCSILIAGLVISLIALGTAHLVHLGVDFNPGLREDNNNPVETLPPTSEQAPGDETQKPGDETQTPGDETQKPGDETQKPGDETQTPGDETQTPGDETQKPGDETQKPGDETQKPGDETQTPGDETQTPGVTPAINAPDTMKYGVPVSIKLVGIDADNLKYGNENFISIVKVSDSEVVLTLVGIVNDAGQVEIVPASGYITVTDSISGTNVSISIVE